MGLSQADGADLMRVVVAAFAQSDLRPLLDAIHEEIVWKSASRQENVFRFSGDHKNLVGVLGVLSNISMDYTFHELKPKEILAQGDVIWGYFDARLSLAPKAAKTSNPKTISLDIAIRWRLKDDKIVEHQTFFDTAALLTSSTEALT